MKDFNTNERVGYFAYGSGAIGEFYSGLILPGASEEVQKLNLDQELAARRRLTVIEYEELEKLREGFIENPSFEPDFSFCRGLYEDFYQGKGYLVLKQVKDFYRAYDWS